MNETLNWWIAGPVLYLGLIVFVGVTLRKVLTIMQMPRHLRWDLYPVAHDGPAGSPFQKEDFWKEKQQVSLFHELAEMAEEIMLLKRTFLYNRKVWWFSYPMHAGFYLIFGWMALLIVGAVIELATGLTLSYSSTIFWAQLFNLATVVAGVVGLLLGFVGTAGLLWLRYTDENLRDYSAPITYFNLYLILALFGVGLLAFGADPSFSVTRQFVGSLLVLKPTAVPFIMTVESILLAIFLIYLPFSRMLHFAAKYFFYHNIMWEDEPVRAGSGLEQAIGGYLGYQMNWSAEHIRPGRSWLEQATTNPTKEKQEANR